MVTSTGVVVVKAKQSLSPIGLIAASTTLFDWSAAKSFAVWYVLFCSSSHWGSAPHVALQQSPETTLPSSHASFGVLTPSPHTLTHMLGEPLHM